MMEEKKISPLNTLVGMKIKRLDVNEGKSTPGVSQSHISDNKEGSNPPDQIDQEHVSSHEKGPDNPNKEQEPCGQVDKRQNGDVREENIAPE